MTRRCHQNHFFAKYMCAGLRKSNFHKYTRVYQKLWSQCQLLEARSFCGQLWPDGATYIYSLQNIIVIPQEGLILSRKLRSSRNSVLGASCNKLEALVTICGQMWPPTCICLQHMCEFVQVGYILSRRLRSSSNSTLGASYEEPDASVASCDQLWPEVT